MNYYSQKGVSLYFAVVITTILLAIVLGLTTILVSQLKIIRGMGDSVVAFFAADRGMERTLYNIYGQGKLATSTETWNDHRYETTISIKVVMGVTSTVVSSMGKYKETRRAIEARLSDVISPYITNCHIVPPSGPPGTLFTVTTTITAVPGETVVDYPTFTIEASSTNLHDDGSPWDTVAGDDIYENNVEKWDSTGYATGTIHSVRIDANDSAGHPNHLDCGTITLE